MATKAKGKPKGTKKAPKRPVLSGKSIRLKAKAAVASRNGGQSSRPGANIATPKRAERVESRRTSGASTATRSTPAPPVRSKHFTSAVQAYEAAIKLMHAEAFEKAIRCFRDIVSEHSEEPEIQGRAKVLIHACEKKLHENDKTVLKSAEDHYNVGIADLNRRDLASSIQHLEHALKLAPKADHVLYALAAANGIQGNSEQAINNLKQAIHLRPQNRFLAARDSDFESLQENPEFKQLVTPPEK
jgi:tetratricopeptide (TPR) repeat protein